MTDEQKMEPVTNGNVQTESESMWYDSLVKVVQEFLDFNMIKYTDEKAPRLKYDTGE